ncbi:MAG: helicase HerA-like domain-containing protein [Candidatus Micrarchaeota archaeon]
MKEKEIAEPEEGMEDNAEPRPVEGERVKKSLVKEDVDIFDEVFEGKTEKHTEEEIENKIIKTEEKKNEEIEDKTEENNEKEITEDAEKEVEEKTENNSEKRKKEETNSKKRKTQEKEEKTGKKTKKKNKSDYQKKELTSKEKKLLRESEDDELEEELPEKEEIKKEIVKKAKRNFEDDYLTEEEFDEADIDGIEYYSGEEKYTLADEKKAEIKETPFTIPLKFLEDLETENAFIGRKKTVFERYGEKASLFVGKVNEEEQTGKNILLDSLNPHVVFVCGARGSGKCVTGDTIITLESGKCIEIQEIYRHNEAILGLNDSLKIEAMKKEGFYEREVEKVLYIKLRSGKEIKLTPEHPLLTIEGWKPVQELKQGSRIATPREIPAFGNNKMKENEIKILAYLIAEGHLGNQFVLFSNADEKIMNEFQKSVLNYDSNLKMLPHGKYAVRVSQIKKEMDLSNVVRNGRGQFTSSGYVVAQKSSLMKWLEEIDLYGKLSGEKFIPEEIIQLEKEQTSLFLNRLFSCDGTIHRINKSTIWQISVCTVSEKMSKQIHHLLLRFGILSKIRFKKTKFNGKIGNAFEIVLNADNVLKFIQEIGFFGEKEEKQKIALKEMSEKTRNPNVDTIPKEIWNQFKVKNWHQIGRELEYKNIKSTHNTKNYAPSREKLFKMAQIEGNKEMQKIAEANIFWDEITEIKEIKEKTKVYDISVPEFHNFIANDIIIHNSYVLGVLAEELALKNKDVGVVVIDPIGVFWSMRYPNKEVTEVAKLSEWNLVPQGLDNIKVFIPEGIKSEVPKSTFDSTFSIQPSLLTAEDWCLTFGMERFGPSGLLLSKVLKKLEHGFKAEGKYIKAKKNYSLNDMIYSLEKDEELNSRERGYKQDSIRALVSRFEAAKSWGIFSEKGTPLGELSREGQLTILDTSFLEDDVTALVIGIIARRLLSARKISTRKEAAKKFKKNIDEMLELDVPPTWLFIDEAHTLIPSGNVKTPATSALVEYVKQGRRPGCSLVFATQQPSAIDTKVLSQLDILISHKLVFDDDIKAIFKRVPSIVPTRYKKSSFVRTLSVGTALVADRREETSRAFVMDIRPRMSQHEGRDAETSEANENISETQVLQLATEMIWRKLNEEELAMEKVNILVNTLNGKYKSAVMLSSVLDALEEKGAVIEATRVYIKGKEKIPEEEKQELETEEERYEREVEEGLKTQEMEKIEGTKEKEANTKELGLALRIDEKSVLKLAEQNRKKKTFRLFGSEEKIKGIVLHYEPFYRVSLNDFDLKKEFVSVNVFVNAVTGELMHYGQGKFIESKGFNKTSLLHKDESFVFRQLMQKKTLKEITEKNLDLSEEKAKKVISSLAEKGFVKKEKREGRIQYSLNSEIDLPFTPRHKLINSVNNCSFTESFISNAVKEKFSVEEINSMIKGLWPNSVVKKAEKLFRPVYYITLEENGKEKTLKIDGNTGQLTQ